MFDEMAEQIDVKACCCTKGSPKPPFQAPGHSPISCPQLREHYSKNNDQTH